MLELYTYKLPFKTPFITGSAVYNNREGVLIRYKTDNTDIVAEASPLPGFSNESIEDVKRALFHQKNNIEEFLESNFEIDDIKKMDDQKELRIPSIQFACSFLACSALAERRGKTIYDLVGTSTKDSIQVNDIVSHAPADEMERQIIESLQRGFRTIKIKVPHPAEKTASLLSRVQKKFPYARFILDANRSWPVSSFKEISELFSDVSVLYAEEPFALQDMNDLKILKKESSINIALDETISSIENLKKILRDHPDLVLIIKPTVLGNIFKIHETISQYRSSFKYIVCTTTLESSIGRSMVATTACLAGDQNMCHGLHTGPLFANDLLPDLEIKNGSLKCFQKNPATRSFQNIKTSYLKKLG